MKYEFILPILVHTLLSWDTKLLSRRAFVQVQCKNTPTFKQPETKIWSAVWYFNTPCVRVI